MKGLGEYRVWCKDRNEWEEHGTVIAPDGQLLHIISSGLTALRPENHIATWFTGITDMNDMKIFEGDVVRMTWYSSCGTKKECIGVVRYDRDTCRFIIGARKWLQAHGKHLEVIGNIFETPDLLAK